MSSYSDDRSKSSWDRHAENELAKRGVKHFGKLQNANVARKRNEEEAAAAYRMKQELNEIDEMRRLLNLPAKSISGTVLSQSSSGSEEFEHVNAEAAAAAAEAEAAVHARAAAASAGAGAEAGAEEAKEESKSSVSGGKRRHKRRSRTHRKLKRHTKRSKKRRL